MSPHEPKPLDYAPPLPLSQRQRALRRYLALASCVVVAALAWWVARNDPAEPGPLLPISIMYGGGVVLWVLWDWARDATGRR